MTSFGDDARETLTIAGLEKAKARSLEQHLRLRAPQTWTVLCASVDQHLRNDSCSLCGKRGHLSRVCRSSGGNASARAVELEPAEPEEEIQHVWALSVCDIFGLLLDVLSVCDNSHLPSNEGTC